MRTHVRIVDIKLHRKTGGICIKRHIVTGIPLHRLRCIQNSTYFRKEYPIELGYLIGKKEQ